jgi:hypothetical protein
MKDRRSEPRNSADRMVEVQIMTGFRPSVRAQLVDLSPSGVRLRVNRPLPEGTRLNFLICDERIFGIVRYCVPVDNNFDTGVLIEYAIRPEQASA